MAEVAEMTREEIVTAIERARMTARELLDLQCTDDPERAFANALKFLMQAANVRDDFKGPSIRPAIALRVLIAEFGIVNVRSWVQRIGRQIAKEARL